MNRKEIIKFYGHPQTQLATQLGLPKQRLTEWIKAKGVTDRSRDIADLTGCQVTELFFPNVLQDDFSGEAIEQLEIALEGLRSFSEKTGMNTDAIAAEIWELAKGHFFEVPLAGEIII